MSSTYARSGTPIEGAVALVTGGNRGFGRALVDELLGRGAGDLEILADDTTRAIKSQLSEDLTALYAQLAAS